MVEDKKILTFELKPNRIETLSDGVFAIVMTLLVLDLTVPQVNIKMVDTVDIQLLKAFSTMWPIYLSYAVSFLVLGIYWFFHHFQFHYIKRSDGIFAWLNIFFLMSVTFIPFSTKLLGLLHIYSIIAIVIYGINNFIIILFSNFIWWYAVHRNRLVDADLSPKIIKHIRIRLIILATAFPVSIALSYANRYLGIAIYAVFIIAGIIVNVLSSRINLLKHQHH